MVKGVGRRVEADQPAAAAYEGDHRPLLGGVHRQLAGGQQEHHRDGMPERNGRELGGAAQEHHAVAPAAGGDGAHRRHRGRDRHVVVAERLGEDEHRREGWLGHRCWPGRWRARLRRARRRAAGHERGGHHRHCHRPHRPVCRCPDRPEQVTQHRRSLGPSRSATDVPVNVPLPASRARTRTSRNEAQCDDAAPAAT